MSTNDPTTRQMEDFWASDGTEQPAAKSHDRAEGVSEFQRWLEQHDREVSARAWDEGYRTRGADAIYTGLTGYPRNTPNPYELEEA